MVIFSRITPSITSDEGVEQALFVDEAVSKGMDHD